MEFFDEKIRDYISSNTNLKYEFEYEQFKVGRSNITYKIFDDSNVLVLRRPPLEINLSLLIICKENSKSLLN
tara:strand:+ start:1792 stop:2007 length:216 start_codon:yes stop_codon:yes gene_type:complete